jgi:hypothetical protein
MHHVKIVKIIDFSDKLPATALVKEEQFSPKFGNCYHSNMVYTELPGDTRSVVA